MSRAQAGVIVTGANGWIGRELCGQLQARGVHVVACDLEEQPGAWDTFVSLDLCEDRLVGDVDFAELMQSADKWSLIHCAGYAHRPIETPAEVKRFYAINARGTERVEWCKALGVERIVYISSIAFYDWETGGGYKALKEDASLRGATAYADSKLKGELAVIESGLDYRVARLATVFGAGDRANFAKLAKALKAGRFIVPGRGEAQKSVISVHSAAQCLAEWSLMAETPYHLMNLGYAQAPTLDVICESFVRCCDFRPPKRVPVPLLRAGAVLGDLLAKLRSNFPLTSMNVGKLTRSTCVDCSRAVELFPELATSSFQDELSKAAEYYKNLDG